MADNGSGRMDRIEATLDRITERMDHMAARFDLMVDHHDAEFKSLMKWQVAMQSRFEDFERQRQVDWQERKTRDQQIDERIDKLVAAIGELIRSLPKQQHP
jgi:hypothetical protein